MFVSRLLFCPVDVGTNPTGKVSSQWRMVSYAAREMNSGKPVQPFRDIRGSERCSWTSSGHHGWVSIILYNTFYTFWGTSQGFPEVYSVFTVVFVLTLQNDSHPLWSIIFGFPLLLNCLGQGFPALLSARAAWRDKIFWRDTCFKIHKE